MAMDLPPDFPSFEQSSFYFYWHQADAAGLFSSPEHSANCLNLAKDIYARTRRRALGQDPDAPDVSLIS
jgi:hypothetical protein